VKKKITDDISIMVDPVAVSNEYERIRPVIPEISENATARK